jgi:hypothetical protein
LCAEFKKNILNEVKRYKNQENPRGLKGAKQKYIYSERRQVKRYKTQGVKRHK